MYVSLGKYKFSPNLPTHNPKKSRASLVGRCQVVAPGRLPQVATHCQSQEAKDTARTHLSVSALDPVSVSVAEEDRSTPN